MKALIFATHQKITATEVSQDLSTSLLLKFATIFMVQKLSPCAEL